MLCKYNIKMEELLMKGYRYTFYIGKENLPIRRRKFTATFQEIEYHPFKTLFVYDYLDKNGYVPGSRTIPFEWINEIVLENSWINDFLSHDKARIETIQMTSTQNTDKQI